MPEYIDKIKDGRNLAIIILVIFIIFTLSSKLGFGDVGDVSFGKKSLENYASLVIEKCKDAKWKPGCYDEEIPKLMDEISFEDSFKVTKIIQNKVNDYWYCHVLGHNLSAKETAKDPSLWMNVITRCPSGVCSNGCIHGAFQERFRTEVLSDEEIELVTPDLKAVCEPRENFSPTGLEQASCYHALGHLTMYMTGAKVEKSIKMCDTIVKNFKQMCYDGVFMQIFQPLEPEDFALVAEIEPKTKEEAINFCRKYSADPFAESTCLREAWPLWREDVKKPEGLMDFCNMAIGNDNKIRCFSAMFYVNVPQLGFNLEKITNLCNGLPKNISAQCFANSASRVIETDYGLFNDSVKLCQAAEKNGVGDRCYQELSFYASYNYHIDSPESKALCNSLPTFWKEQCLSGAVDSPGGY
jgi:hypothetical protein